MSAPVFETNERFPMRADVVEHIAEVYALGEDDGSPEYVYRYTIQRLCASHQSLREDRALARNFALQEVDDWASRRQNLVIEGEKLEGAITAHYRYLLNCIGNERRKGNPDRGLIEVLSDAVRFTREHVYLMGKYVFAEEVEPTPPTLDPNDDPLFVRIESAIRLASELGPDSVYDFVHGRGMKIERERIQDEIATLRSLASPSMPDEPSESSSRATDATP